VKIKTVGLLGFGRFGQMAYRYLRQTVDVRVYDQDSRRLEGVPEKASLSEVVENQLVLLSVPISRMQEVCQQIAPLLRAGQLVVDTCSVKARPVAWMTELLPPDVDILGTHPLFGPDSGKEGIAGLKIALCPVRIRPEYYSQICNYLRSLELVILETTPEEHDQQIAQSQAIFHLIAQVLKRLDWGVKPISTLGPETFYRLVRTVQRDTDQLFLDMERENPFAAQYRKQFIEKMLEVDRELKRGSE